jgi:hypothetical protein
VRAASTPAERARTLALIRSELAWEQLLRLAALHRCLPQVCERLETLSGEGVPAPALVWLRSRQRETARRSLVLATALGGLLQAFAREGLRAIAFKGPVLALDLYGRVASRHFDDLDLLVSPEAFPRAAALLRARGFELSTEFDWESSFVDPRRGTAVDLHRDVAMEWFSLPFDFEALWRRSRSLEIAGAEVRTFSLHDGLLVQCVQLVNDWLGGQRRVAALRDLDARLRREPGPDWDELLREARALDGLGILLFALALARQVLDTPLPQRVAGEIQRRQVIRSLSDDAQRALFEDPGDPPPTVDRLAIYARLRRRPSRRLRDYFEIARVRVDEPGNGATRLPWPVRFLVHPLLRPGWALGRSLRRRLRAGLRKAG